MKNLRKIIALFVFILVAGIFVTVITINTSLNKTEVPKETVEVQKDSVSLLKADKKRV
ncbi:hypothetical protein [Polaribacter sp. Hel_I_88]|uniref:hypothetical protein n=1 Tax=Polaribacter sp. Hel_I_88 TaxID=1250006 RepID=UPI000AA2C10C|nr:hypothetical protein [Polaribacter sp. Hel_I_88]